MMHRYPCPSAKRPFSLFLSFLSLNLILGVCVAGAAPGTRDDCQFQCNGHFVPASAQSLEWIYFIPSITVGDCETVLHRWDFGDGGSSTSMGSYYAYTQAGDYTWTYTVYDEVSGASCSLSDTIHVTQKCTIADFSPSPGGSWHVGKPLHFSSNVFTHEGCVADSTFWDFGNGDTSTEMNPVYTYQAEGSYFFSCTVTYGDVSETETRSISIHTPDPAFNFGIEAICSPQGTGYVPQEVHCWAVGADPQCGDPGYQWDFGDGGGSTDQNPTHVYTSGGSTVMPIVTVQVWNDGLEECQEAGTNGGSLYLKEPCAIDCTADVPSYAGVGERVYVSAIPNDSFTCGEIMYFWDFGDFGSAFDPETYHTYYEAGVYNWTLRAVDDVFGTECVQTGSVTVGMQCIEVGALNFCSDSVVVSGNTYTFGPDTSINGVLFFEGSSTLSLASQGAATGTLSTTGNIFVHTNSGQEVLFDAPPTLNFAVDGDGGKLVPSFGDITIHPTLAGLPLMSGNSDVAIGASTVTIKPYFWIGVPGIAALGSAEATLVYTHGAAKQLAGARILQGAVTPSIKFLDIAITYDPVLDRLEGTISVSFPFLNTWSAAATVRIEHECFDGFYISVGLPAPVLIGPLPVSGFTLDVNHLCDVQGNYDVFFGGNIGIPGVPGEILTLNDVGILYDPPYRGRAQFGNLMLLGYTVAGAHGRVNVTPGREAVTFTGQTGLASFIEGQSDLFVNVGRSSLYGSVGGTLQIPDFDCHWANVPCRAFRAALKSTVGLPVSSSYTSMETRVVQTNGGAWHGVLRGRPLFEPLTLAVQIDYLDGDWSLLVGRDYASLYDILRAPEAVPAIDSTDRSVTLAEAAEPVLFTVAADTAVPRITLTTPEGQIVTPQNIDTFPGMSYIEDEEGRVALFLVDLAWPGTWTLSEEVLDAGELTFAALTPTAAPEAAFDSVQQAGSLVQIELTVNGATEEISVSLFASEVAEPSSGTDIAWDLDAASGAVHAAWDTLEWPEGTYYLMARTDDGRHVPTWTVHPEPVVVDRGTLAAPTGLAGTRSGSVADLNWTPSPSPGAAGHAVKFTDTPDVPGYRQERNAAVEGAFHLDDLDPEAVYRFCVQAYDADGNRSVESEPLLFEPISVPGDCDGSGSISIGEVQRAINMFLGAEPAGCGADVNADGTVSIGEIQQVINGFLGG